MNKDDVQSDSTRISDETPAQNGGLEESIYKAFNLAITRCLNIK
jgi:hypothetical protein